MLLWLAKGALGDAYTVAWSLDFARRQTGITQAVVVGSAPVLKVVQELEFVEKTVLLPEKSDLLGWIKLRKICKSYPIQILGLQGKGRHLSLLASSLRPPLLISWQSLQVSHAQNSVPLGEFLQNPNENFSKLGFARHPLSHENPTLPFKGIDYSKHRKGLVFAPLTSPTWPSKAWPMSHSLELANLLKADGLPLTIVGAKSEAHALEPFRADGHRVACGLSVSELGTLLAQSQATLSGDSMLAHAAPLYGTKAIILLGPTTERYISRHKNLPEPVVLKHQELSCLGCHKPVCPLPGEENSACLKGLGPQSVRTAVWAAIGTS